MRQAKDEQRRYSSHARPANEVEGIGKAPFHRQESGCYAKTTRMWTSRDEVAFRKEVERRFRERSCHQEWLNRPEWTRVSKDEMRAWAEDLLGRIPPESRDEWTFSFVKWYQRMVRRNRVHMRFGVYALCGIEGRLDPLKTDDKSEVTCPSCRGIIREA